MERFECYKRNLSERKRLSEKASEHEYVVLGIYEKPMVYILFKISSDNFCKTLGKHDEKFHKPLLKVLRDPVINLNILWKSCKIMKFSLEKEEIQMYAS